jgi:hypothetical protein
MNWKGCGWKRSWHNFKIVFWHLPRGTEENRIKSGDNLSPGRDLKRGPPTYEAEVLTTAATFCFLSHIVFIRYNRYHIQ